jgi:hypothetical protein
MPFCLKLLAIHDSVADDSYIWVVDGAISFFLKLHIDWAHQPSKLVFQRLTLRLWAAELWLLFNQSMEDSIESFYLCSFFSVVGIKFKGRVICTRTVQSCDFNGMASHEI